MKDNNGIEIEVGDMVAYNRSGDIVKGVVEKFGPPLRGGWQIYRRGGPLLTWTNIRNSRDHKLSKVKRPQSIMVIAKRELLPHDSKRECPRWVTVV